LNTDNPVGERSPSGLFYLNNIAVSHRHNSCDNLVALSQEDRFVELIDSGHVADRHDALLSDTAKTSGAGPLRFLAVLLLGSVVVIGTGWALKDRLVPLAARLVLRAETLLPGYQPAVAGPTTLLATPILTGPLTLPPLSPAELMQQYPPVDGRSLREGTFDQPAWQRLQRPAGILSQPHLAVLVSGLGLNKALTTAAILYLPPAVSLSFSPYAPDLAGWIDTARAQGHEALVDLPMESAAPQDDPGGDGLMTGLKPQENSARLNRIIDRAPHALGVATGLGSRFLADQGALQPVLAVLAAHGLAIIETSPDPRMLTSQVAAAAGLQHLKTTIAIDEAEGRDEILRNLSTLTAAAAQGSHPLVVVAPSPLSLALIDGWCTQLANLGLALTPASNMLAQ
jgi:polysaccharide deacetylase 2 family uncharacterized protein YibQ